MEVHENTLLKLSDFNPFTGRDQYVARARRCLGEKAEMLFPGVNNRYIALTLYENLVLIGGGALLTYEILKGLESFLQ